MKSVVLDGFAVNPGDLSFDFLGQFGEYTVYDKTLPEQVAERIGDCDIVLTNRMRVGANAVGVCPNLKYVTSLGTGYDMIDVPLCRANGIEVCNVPGYSTDSVAQLAFTLLLNLATDVEGFRNIVREGKWTGMDGVRYQTVPYMELAGKTVGIYGCGTIGRRFGAICAAFGMRVLGYRRSVRPGETADGITYTDVDTLLAESDFVSFHCPLTDETRGLADRDFLARMKKGSYLINTSRGAVIDETALADALASGHLAGAGIDVMCKEPPDRDNPLLTSPRCIITPHCAWVTVEARRRLLRILEDNIRSFTKTGRGINRVF